MDRSKQTVLFLGIALVCFAVSTLVLLVKPSSSKTMRVQEIVIVNPDGLPVGVIGWDGKKKRSASIVLFSERISDEDRQKVLNGEMRVPLDSVYLVKD